jgi:voltage-gated potassium channel Kch
MKKTFIKILAGNSYSENSDVSGYKFHIQKIIKVWHGDHYKDYGVERLFRLIVVTLFLFYPGILIENIFNSKTYIIKKLAVEAYVLIKTIFPLFILTFGWYTIPFIYYLNIYLLSETYLYLFSKIFLAEHHINSSNKRTLLLLIFNFIESAFSFAVIYMAGNYLNVPINSTIDAIYFSLITSATVGFGDLHPITKMGKLITVTQVMCSVSFIVLFFNFFSGEANQHTIN